MSSKRYNLLPKETKKLKKDTFDKLIAIVKKNCTTKFDESIDIHIQVNVKQKKSEVNLRTAVNLPAGTGKKTKIAVVCEDSKLAEAKKSGADAVGSDDLIKEISTGKINFEKLIATPGMMIKLSKLGKILGPKGLMPNPKLGTVSENILETVKASKLGQIEIKNDKDGNVGFTVGKKSFSNENLIKNFNAVLETMQKEKPSGIKGDLIKNVFITSTMGVPYKLKLDKNF
jgi:large subunit ribosomal protein L1|tara:strand:+ start:216 stop:902 length:687 start_codon:yes stop_codon:yes gene_type:complete